MSENKSWFRAAIAVVAACAVALLGQTAQAASMYWDTSDTVGLQAGNGLAWDTTNINWNTAADGSASPRVAWADGDDAFFTASGTSVIGVGTVTANRLAFGGTGYTLSGGALTINGGITAGQTAAISSPITLGAEQTWSVASGMTLTASGVVSGSGVGFTKSGTGTLVLGTPNTFSGGVTVSQGVLRLNNGTAGGSGTITLGDAGTGSSNVELALADNINNNVTVSANGTGTAIIRGAGQFKSGGGTYTLNRPTTLIINGSGGDWWYGFGNITGNVGTLTVDSTTAGDNSRVVWGGTNTFTGNVVINPNGNLQTNATTAIPITAGLTVNGRLRVFNGGGGGGATTCDGLNGTGILMALGGYSNKLSVGNNNGSGTFSGTIQSGNNFALTKNGTGTQELIGANIRPSGVTTLNDGVLKLTNTTAWASSNIAFGAANAPTLQLNAPALGDSFTIGSQITGGSAGAVIEKMGLGTLNLNPAAGSNFVGSGTHALKVTAGTLYLGGTNFATPPAVSVGNGSHFGGPATVGNLTLATGATLEGGKGGTGTLTAADVTIGSSSTDTAIIKGSLSTTAGYKAIAVNNLTLNGGNGTVLLNASGAGLTSGAYYDVIVSANEISTPNVASPVDVFSSNARAYSPFVDATGKKVQLHYDANASIYWASSDSMAWDTEATNWKLTSDNSGTQFRANDVVFFNDGAAQTTVDISAADVNPVSVTFNNSSSDYTLQGSKGIMTGALAKQGTGTLTIANANSYAGGTTFSAGTLNLDHNNALGSGALTITGGTLDSTVAGITLANNPQAWNGDFTFAGTQDLNLGAGAVALGASRQLTVAAGTLTAGGAISGSGFGLTKLGGGTLLLTGANTYSGGTTINSGVLQLGNGATNGTLTGAIAIGPAGTLAVHPNTGGYTLSNALTGGGNLLKAGANNLTLNTANAGFTGTTTISAGTLTLANSAGVGTTGTIVLGDANTGAGNVMLLLTAGGSVTVTNPIVVSALGSGTATISCNANLNTFSGALTLNRPTTLAGPSITDRYGYSGKISGDVGTLTIDCSRITFDQNAANANDFTGTVVVNPNRTFQLNSIHGLSAQHSVTANGNFYLNTGIGSTVTMDALNGSGTARPHPAVGGQPITLVLGANGGSGSFSGVLANGGGGSILSLVKSGFGSQVLGGANTYTGPTTIKNGTLQLAAAGALPANTALSFGDTGTGGTLDLNGQNVSVSSLTIRPGAPAADQVITNTAATDAAFTFNGTGITTFGGLITEAGGGGKTGLTVGSGTLVLNADNGYTGLTTINAGTFDSLKKLYVNGAQTGPVSVSEYALLGGKGQVGDVTVQSMGAMEAGSGGAGSLTASSLTLSAADMYIGGDHLTGSIASYREPGQAAIILNGVLNVNSGSPGTITLHLGGTSVDSGTYHLIKHVGPINGIDPTGIANPTFEATFQLNFTDVPTLTPRQNAFLVNNSGTDGNPGYVDWVVVGGHPVWTGMKGGVANNAWMPSDSGAKNWKLSNDGTETYYMDATDTVSFDDSAGVGNTTVDISHGDVSPFDVSFENDALTYTLKGSNGIAGATKLSKSGAGTLVVTNVNNYTGGTVINNGSIQLGGATATLGTGNISFGANAPATAKLQLNGYDFMLPGLTTDAANPGFPVVENGGAADATLIVNNSANAEGVTFAGVLQDGAGGKLAFAKDGLYDVTLAGPNTYSGDTALIGGNLKAGADDTLPHGAGKGAVVFDGGILDLNGHQLSVNRVSLLSSGSVTNNVAGSTGTLSVGDNNVSSTLEVPLQDGLGKVALNKIGGGVVQFSGWNAHTGGTTVTAGTLQMMDTSALGGGGLTVNGGTFDLNANPISVPTLAGTGGVITDNSAGPAVNVFTVNTMGNSTFGGVIQDGANGTQVALNKTGTRLLTLDGTAANTYTGGTTLNAGGFWLQKPDSTNAIPGDLSISTTPGNWGNALANGVYLMANEQIADTGVITWVDQNSDYVGLFLEGHTETVGGLVYAGNSVSPTTPRAIIENADQWAWTLSDNGTLIVNTAADTSYSYAGIIRDRERGATILSFIKDGPGTQILTGPLVDIIPTAASTFTGHVTVKGGTLVAAAVNSGTATALGLKSAARTITVNAGGTLEFWAPNVFGNHNETAVPNLVVRGGTLTNADPALSGAINNALNNITLDGGTLTSTTGNSFIIGGPLGRIDTYGAWNLNGTVTSRGNSMISTTAPSDGHVLLASVGAVPTTTFDVQDGTLTVSTDLIDGDVGELASSLIKAGAGKMVVSGINTYRGGTTVNAGTLEIAGAGALPAGGALTIGAGGTVVLGQGLAAGGAAAASQAAAPVPEPGTFALLAAALAALAVARWRRRR